MYTYKLSVHVGWGGARLNYVQLAHSNHCCTVTCSCGWCNELYHCTHTENTYNCRRRLPLTTLCAALHKSYVNLSINSSNYKHVWPECLYFVPLSYLCTSDASLLSLLRMYVHPQGPFIIIDNLYLTFNRP